MRHQTTWALASLFMAAAALTGGCDAADAAPPEAHQPPPPTSDVELEPLRLGLSVHLEGWPVQTEVAFRSYVEQIREYRDLTHAYGATFTWEASNDGDASTTGCEFDEADVTQALVQLDLAIALRNPGRPNFMVFIWSFGQALDQDLLAQLLEGIEERVDRGEVEWNSYHQLLDGFQTWTGA